MTTRRSVIQGMAAAAGLAAVMPAWAHAPPLSSPCLCGAFESLILPHLRCLTAVPEKAVLSQMLLICGATAGPATGTETALGIRAETAANKSVAN